MLCFNHSTHCTLLCCVIVPYRCFESTPEMLKYSQEHFCQVLHCDRGLLKVSSVQISSFVSLPAYIYMLSTTTYYHTITIDFSA